MYNANTWLIVQLQLRLLIFALMETIHEILPTDHVMTNPLKGSIRSVPHINEINLKIQIINIPLSNLASCHKA